MSLCDYLFVCRCVFAWQKIDQAGGPETFFLTLFGLTMDKLDCSIYLTSLFMLFVAKWLLNIVIQGSTQTIVYNYTEGLLQIFPRYLLHR